MNTNQEQPRHVEETGIQVGDFFCASWGYGQINIDFWQVESWTNSGKSIHVRRCMTDALQYAHELNDVNDKVYPGEAYGELYTKRVKYMWCKVEGIEGQTWRPFFTTEQWAGAPAPSWCGPNVMPIRWQTNLAFGH